MAAKKYFFSEIRHNNFKNVCANQQSPTLGDLKIAFFKIPPTPEGLDKTKF